MKRITKENNEMECYTCEKGNLVKKKVEFKLYGESFGHFDAEVCDKCGEQFFDEKTSDEMDEIAKKKGLWGLESETNIAKAGGSLVIRVNKNIAQFLRLKKGEKVRLHPEDRNKLIVEV
ncbi:YgiT-type zinc finger protein [Candidatus Woesearchaeota archaeon]|nr:YgiT-type zinc finger protein [Candidatus Woesearchaeota archaeon]